MVQRGVQMIIERWCDNPKLGCLSEIIIHGTHFCYAIEQSWNNNLPYKSCVPVGEYELVQYDSPTYGDSLALYNPLLNVMVHREDADSGDRFACLIHSANWAHELQGCLAPGSAISWGKHKEHEPTIMVTNSTSTLNQLRKHLTPGDKVLIRWKNA